MPTANGVASHRSVTSRDDIVKISQHLVQARQAAISLSAFPGVLPSDTKTAYAIQDRSISEWSDEVAGWKVGGISPSFLERFGAKRLAGPIFKSQTLTTLNNVAVTAAVFERGFAAVEAEFILRTSVPISPKDPKKSSQQLRDCIASVHIGAEIASSPMSAINELGPGAIISDFGNNGGLIVGPQIVNWHERAGDDIDVSVSINGTQVGAIRKSIEDDAFNAFEFLVDLSRSRGIELPAGTLVTCGALSGIHEVKPGDQSCVVFEELGMLTVEFAKLRPTL